ncbi:MAG: DMT family transporter [Thermoplasmatota archaeon]
MKRESVGFGFIAVTVFLWSTIEVVTKLIGDAVPALTIAFLRFLIGGAALLPLIIIYGRRIDWNQVGFKDHVKLVLASFLGITCTFSLFHIGLDLIDASSAATLISMVPLASAFISFWILKERMGLFGITGLLLGGSGVLFIYFSEGIGWSSFMAVLLMLVTVVCFSIYAVIMKPLNRKMDAKVTTSISLFIGGLMMAPVLILDGSPLWVSMDGSTMGYMIYLSVIAVGLSYLLYFMGLDRTEVSRGNSLMYLKPLAAGFLAYLILGETPSFWRVVGILVITFSVYLVVMDRRLQRRFGLLRKNV